MGKFSATLRSRLSKTKAAAVRSSDRLSQAMFMAQRQMFGVGPDGLRIAEPSDDRGHRAWMADLDERAFRQAVRGYHLDEDLVFYRGALEQVRPSEIGAILPRLVADLGLGPQTRIWSGARLTATDALMGHVHLGSLADWPAITDRGPGWDEIS